MQWNPFGGMKWNNLDCLVRKKKHTGKVSAHQCHTHFSTWIKSSSYHPANKRQCLPYEKERKRKQQQHEWERDTSKEIKRNDAFQTAYVKTKTPNNKIYTTVQSRSRRSNASNFIRRFEFYHALEPWKSVHERKNHRHQCGININILLFSVNYPLIQSERSIYGKSRCIIILSIFWKIFFVNDGRWNSRKIVSSVQTNQHLNSTCYIKTNG